MHTHQNASHNPPLLEQVSRIQEHLQHELVVDQQHNLNLLMDGGNHNPEPHNKAKSAERKRDWFYAAARYNRTELH